MDPAPQPSLRTEQQLQMLVDSVRDYAIFLLDPQGRIIVTDAEVSDEGRILRLASEEARETDRRRISVLCIDAAPNSFLANELGSLGYF